MDDYARDAVGEVDMPNLTLGKAEPVERESEESESEGERFARVLLPSGESGGKVAEEE